MTKRINLIGPLAKGFQIYATLVGAWLRPWLATSLPGIAILVALPLVPTAVAANKAPEITDLLANRWFEVEVIIFERLPVLDINTEEKLTQTKLRRWPNNITEMLSSSQAALPSSERLELALDPITKICIGYPELPQDPPLQNEFSDAQDYAERIAQLSAQDDQQLSAQDDLSEGTTDDTTEMFEQSQPPPKSALEILQENVDAFEQQLYRSSFIPLQELALTAEAKALNRQSHLRPLIHKRWRQPVPPRQQPQPLRFQLEASERAPLTLDGQNRIDGYLEITVARYLHVNADLWYHADSLGVEPTTIGHLPNTESADRNNAANANRQRPNTLGAIANDAVTADVINGSTQSDGQNDIAAGQDFGTRSAIVNPETTNDSVENSNEGLVHDGAPRYMQLSQSRRMRSGDLHYLDHPKIGIIIRIDPIAIPEALEEQRENLD